MITHFISVDIEASGPVPGLYSMLSIGAVITTYDGRGVRVGDSFYSELQPLPDAGVDLEAMKYTGGLQIEKLRAEGVEPKQALLDLSDWLKSNGCTDPIFVAQNAPFDWMYVEYYCRRFEVKNPFGIFALDIKAYAMGKLGCSWRETGSETLARRLGLELQPAEEKHNARNDAIWQANLFSHLLME